MNPLGSRRVGLTAGSLPKNSLLPPGLEESCLEGESRRRLLMKSIKTTSALAIIQYYTPFGEPQMNSKTARQMT